jgi:RNA recognition motif-containing protein
MEGCQLFVGNLSWETGWRELKDHFRQCGDIDHTEVGEGTDGCKRGYGLIRYRNARDAANLIVWRTMTRHSYLSLPTRL